MIFFLATNDKFLEQTLEESYATFLPDTVYPVPTCT